MHAAEAPMLKLIVEKGPKVGETLERKPGSTIRIGRVVKGNNFTIKDAGISSKHLLIEFKDMKWVVCDLHTSNGTFLNEVQIEGNKEIELKNGDFIKIGEFTSIKICIGVEEEEEERDLEVKETKGVKKVRGKKGVVETVSVVEGEKKEVGRKTRGRGAANEQVVEEKVGVSASVEVVKRNTRGRPKKEGLQPSVVTETKAASVQVDNVKEGDLESGVGQSRRYPRRGAATKEHQVPQSSLVSVNKNQKIRGRGKTEVEKEQENEASVAESQGKGKSRRGLNAASEDEVLENVEVGVSEMKMVENNEVLKSSHFSQGEPSQSVPVSVPQAPEVQKKSNSTTEGKLTLEKMQKMTLGEWFDYLEIYLPRKIDEDTDKIIEGMRNHAEQYSKFMDEQQKLKTKPTLS
ncbi:Fha domain-containing protein [Thalictrum thalictroides]|uniref:Fha domain-containing protein n=1 Tax=Thalictrum thalictroides TaxID=46969 RepID=A0A7J6UR51_THATH|nr:Fha domain-containing protein [Thalictrum thalictroides]